MIIDANVYWIPEALFEDDQLMDEFLRCAPKGYDLNAYLKEVVEGEPKQVVIEKPMGFANLNYMQGQYEMAIMLADMDQAGIDVGILKVPGCHEWLSLELCRLFNDGMAEYERQSRGRLKALAVVPPWGTPACLEELDRCINELGMSGVQMSAHYGEKYLDDPMFEAHFDWINNHGLTVYVHHTPLPVAYTSLLDYNNLRRSYGRCNDQMTAVGRELFSGFFERFSNIKLVHSMLGGGFFAYKNLLLPKRPPSKDAAARFVVDNDAVLKYLENNLYFEMSHAAPWGQAQMECAVKVLGADHIIFGSSYPVVKGWQSAGPDFVRNLAITEEEKELLLWQTAEKVYGGVVYAEKQ